MKTKFNKKSRNLLIGLLLGDGTISSNYVFKLSHCLEQREYLEWKIKKLNEFGIKNNGVKEYVCKRGYNTGRTVLYSQLSIVPFIKVLRKVFYKPKKNIGNRKLLNRLDELGLAIWYMDDGCLNIRKTNGKVHGFYVRISTCCPKSEAQIIIDYFKEEWNINFYTFHEGSKDDSYSLCCGTKEGIKFINIVERYVSEVECMKHKIQYDLSQRIRPIDSCSESEMENTKVKI